MTHDELLEHINKDINQGGFVSAIGEWFPARSLFALRAVVELHRPALNSEIDEVYTSDVLGCAGCGIDDEYLMWNTEWPCQTIQTILKELE